MPMIAQRRRVEDGSLVIALAVVVVLSALALAVSARTLSALGNARVVQDTSAAGAAADAGVTDAVSALGAWASPADPPQTGAGTIGVAGYRWTVTTIDPMHATISSVGTANGRAHRVVATATRGPAWPWVIASRSSLVLDGPGTITDGRLAAGGALVLRDGAPAGTGQDLLGPGASCSGCGSPGLPQEARLAEAAPPASPAPLPCPVDPATGSITALAAGTYECAGGVSFAPVSTTGDVPVAGPVVIYVIGDGGLANLGLAGAVVNAGGDPSDLVIHLVGAGEVDPGDGADAARFTGIVDAPGATLRSDPCGLAVTGALVLESFACTSPAAGSGPSLVSDPRVVALPSASWQLSGYHDAATAG
jgi:hypothetical protein